MVGLQLLDPSTPGTLMQSFLDWKPFANSADPINPLYTGGLFHCYMVDESNRHFMGVWSILSVLFYI